MKKQQLGTFHLSIQQKEIHAFRFHKKYIILLSLFQDYKKQFENTLQQIEEEKQCLLVAEKRWMDSWNASVEKVKLLY